MLSHLQSCRSQRTKFWFIYNHQQKINHYYNSSPNGKRVPKRVKDAVTFACVNFVIQDGRPFH